MKKNNVIFLLLLCTTVVSFFFGCESLINRKEVVTRHTIESDDLHAVLPVGNGEFCFGTDGTGLQTFSGNTLSHWAWHSFPLPEEKSWEDVPPTGTIDTGRITGPMRQASASHAVSRWMFNNPHPINLGRLRLIRGNGDTLQINEIRSCSRTLNIWDGIHTTTFELDGQIVTTSTTIHPYNDLIAIRIESALIKGGQLAIMLDFPYPDKSMTDKNYYGNWNLVERHETRADHQKNQLTLVRLLDSSVYHVRWECFNEGVFSGSDEDPHKYILKTSAGHETIEFSVGFNSSPLESLSNFEDTRKEATKAWQAYWESGGVIDLSGSKDPRWRELERRIVLSQYLMRSQSSGSLPSGEFGLMGRDFWSSQFHMEMVWWHLAHYALWDRWELSEEALKVYERFLPTAQALAKQFGYNGAKWGKQCGPEGRTATWEGSFVLHWQQPHPIFFAELEYRLNPTPGVLEKWKDVVFATADYMADFPIWDEEEMVYHLSPVRTANENGDGTDPAFEITYWRWGLGMTQKWRERLGLQRNPDWQKVITHLAPLPQSDSVYLFCKDWHNTYTELNYGHPDPLGPFAFLPFEEGVDIDVARKTVQKINETWQWENTWGWDFPWGAMAAARTGQPDIAIDILMKDVPRNTYALNGINEGWYFPGNGGILYAVAMMAAGWDGAPNRHAPGFPDDGTWNIRYEGLNVAP
ncbi:hypothetical protein ACFLU5_15565 [Bacteroidota bacterium]